jgi:hypothetical protein
MTAEFAARTLDGKRKKEVFLCKNKLIIKQRVSECEKRNKKISQSKYNEGKKGI